MEEQKLSLATNVSEYQTIIYALTSLVDEHFENIDEVIGAGKKRKKRTGGYQDHSRRIEMILEYTKRGGKM
ncbi:MAG: hypothetical protein LBE64_18970 [Acinetobacter pittii]|jgi:hypothetical protein|nr:hypothetical protein [Acinetobacter pittii]